MSSKMCSPCGAMRRRFMLAVLYFPVVVLAVEPKGMHRPFNNSVPAILVFGDSTVDSGNNNYYTTPLKSNFRPYGVDFPGHVATGRFTDGRLVTDFIASYVGIKKIVPPYLDPDLKLKDLTTGVSFASAGSGYDELTANMLGVIPMKKQIEYFREYKMKLEAKIGKKKTRQLVRKAAYVVSAGTNDVVIGYYSNPMRQMTSDIDTYLNLLIGNSKEFFQDLKKEGAQNIAVVGLSKIGCVPAVLTINPGDGGIGQRNCNESLSAVAIQFNEKLLKVLDSIKSKKFRIFYADIYRPLEDMIQNPSKFGFEKVDVGCCGTGLLEMTFLCNPSTFICSDPSKYVFFDSVHPTEATYKYIFKTLRPTIDQAIKAFR